MGEFFGALPAVFRALWQFGGAWRGVGVTVGSIALTAGFLLLAKRWRETSGWLSAMAGTMAAAIASFWLLGILPSAWIYFVDAQTDLLEDTVIPTRLAIGNFEIAANFYNVFRDLVVVIESGLAIGVLAYAAIWVQKRYPRALAEGEQSRAQSGGYK